MKIIFKINRTLRKLAQPSEGRLSLRFASSNSTDARLNVADNSSTVDSLEIEHFSRDSQFWWDLKGSLRGLHTFNGIRVPFIVGDTQNLEDKKILDVGCGGGILSEALAKCGMTVTGIDIPLKSINIAKQHSMINQELKKKPTYYSTTIENHAKQYKNHYDSVVASEVIEHVANKELFVKSCVETLKPGGNIFFTTPSRTRLSKFINIWFAENIVNCPDKGTHQYEKFITPQYLQALLEFNGCNVEEIKGYAYNMVTNTWYCTYMKSLFFAIRATKVE